MLTAMINLTKRGIDATILIVICDAFSTLTLLKGQQEEHPGSKKVSHQQSQSFLRETCEGHRLNDNDC